MRLRTDCGTENGIMALTALLSARRTKWCKLAEIYSTKRAKHCSVSINLRKNTISVVLAIKNIC